MKQRKKTSLARSLLLVNPSLSKRAVAKALGISRSSLYHRSLQSTKDEQLLIEILRVHEEDEHYGHRRIAFELGVGVYRTRRVMRRYGVKPKHKRKRQHYPKSQGNSGIPNRIKKLMIGIPNQVWAGDFTELQWHSFTLYLATTIDLYTREIVGASVGLRHSADLIVSALQDAKDKRGGVTPTIFHSDIGSEYESGLCAAWLLRHQVLPSRSGKAHPWENGRQESFYGRFKQELGSLSPCPTLEDAIATVHHRILYYNTKRIHTALRMPPRTFYETWRRTMKLLPAPKQQENQLSTSV